MKAKITLSLLIVLIAAVFVGNSIVGNKMAGEIDTKLKERIAENKLPVAIDYARVKVNPLFSQVKISDISVGALNHEATFKCEMVDVDIPYKEVKRWLESTEFEEIHSLKIKLVKPLVSGEDENVVVAFDDVVVDFDGQLSKEDFENMETKFPPEKQELQLSFSGLKVKLPESTFSTPPLSQLQEQLTGIDAGSWELVYNPDSKEIDIREFSIKSPIISYKGRATFNYEGEGANDFEPRTAAMESHLRLEPKQFEWEDENGGKGEFQLDKLVFNTNSTISFDQQTFPQGDMDFEIVNLKIHYDNPSNQGGSMINFSLKNLEIDHFNFSYHLDNEKLRITDSRIKSSLLEADINADVDMDLSNPANSTIKEAKVTVKNLAPDLEKLLNGFEQQMGKELPRENGAIVMELSGNLAHPTIKGFEF